MTPTLYLHIGLHKTGTSAIQNVCMANQDRLMRAGILFPSAGFKRVPAREPSATRGHSGLIKFFKRPDRIPARNESQALFREMHAADAASLILSSEVFSAPHNHGSLAGVEWFRKKGFDVKVIVFLRRQDKHLDSLYRERLKSDEPSGGETRSINEFWLAEGDAWLDYRTRVGPWVEAVGRENAIVRSYDDAQQSGGVIRDFLSVIGADESLMAMSQANEIHNPSIPPSVTDFLRAYNALIGERFPRRAAIISAIGKMEFFNRSRGSVISPDLWTELQTTYGEQIEELRREWVTGPSALLSFEAGMSTAPISEQAISYADSTTLLRALIPDRETMEESRPEPGQTRPVTFEPGSFGTITTCRENPEQVREFVNYYLNLGAAAMVIYFDDPQDPAMDLFREEPRVICRPCDDSHWLRLLGRPPRTFTERQVKNIEDGTSILRERGVAWIATIDVDELLYAPVPVANILSNVDGRIDIVLAKPLEAIHHEDMREGLQFRSSWFREYTPELSPEQKAVAERHMPGVTEFGTCGCLGHRDGKSFFRSTAHVESYGPHLPRNKLKYLEKMTAADIALLHFDAITRETWERRWIARVTGVDVRTTLKDHRRRQHDHITRVLEAEGRAGLSRVFDEWHVYTPASVTALEQAGLLRKVTIPASCFAGPIRKAPNYEGFSVAENLA
jgi:hypothetical protein